MNPVESLQYAKGVSWSNGFVVPIKDFEALASRVIQLVHNRELRERLGYTGRQMVEQNYTKEIVTRNTLDIYRRLL